MVRIGKKPKESFITYAYNKFFGQKPIDENPDENVEPF